MERKYLKKIIIINLLVFFCFSNLFGCKNSKISEENNTYLKEIDCNFFNEENIDFVYDMKAIDKNKVVILASNNNKLKYFISENNGESWQDKNLDILNDIDNEVNDACISKDNNIVITYKNKEGKYKSSILYSDGKLEELNIDHSSAKGDVPYNLIKFASNGDILLYDGDKNIKQINLKDKTIKNNFNFEYTGLTTTVENKIVNYNKDYIEYYSLDSGKKIDSVKNKMDIKSIYSDDIYSNSLFFINSDGVNKYKIENNNDKFIIEASKTSFGNSNLSPLYFSQVGENEYLCIFMKQEKNGFKYYLKKYFLSNLEVNNNESIRVYSLYENSLMKQIISKYNLENSTQSINYEFGLSEEESDKEADEIKRLNTELMAGKGPDILVLDGLPYISYMEKGILENMDDIINEYIDENSLFNNIIQYYNDSGYYALPLRFNIPIIVGKNIENVSDLITLTEAIKSLYKEKCTSILDIYSPTELIKALYYTNSINWLDENNSINIQEIKSFLENCKEIYEILEKTKSKNNYEYHLKNQKYYESINMYEKIKYLNREVSPAILLFGDSGSKIDIGSMKNFSELGLMITICNEFKNYSYRTWNSNEKGMFIPNTLIGINSRSNTKEESKRFLKLLFNNEYQNIDSTLGLPLNKEVFSNSLNSEIDNAANGEYSIDNKETIRIRKPSNEEITNFISIVENAKISTNDNLIILNQVIDDMEKYILDKQDINKALKNIKNKVDIYLSE